MNRSERMHALLRAAAVALAGFAFAGLAQPAVASDPIDSGHHEWPDDAPPTTLRSEPETSPALTVDRNGYVSVQVNVNAFGQNIIGDAANEPSIAVDPNNPTRLAIGWRQFDTITSNFRQAGVGYSSDGGQTWTSVGPLNAGVFRSDPVLEADDDGTFFYNSLTTLGGGFHCTVYRSEDGGVHWGSGVYAYGGDKQWMTIDRTMGIGRGNVYAYWTSAYSCCPGQFTRSYNNGASYTETTNIPGNPMWGTLTVGPDGTLYVAGRGFTVTKSTTIQNPSLAPQWDLVSGVYLDGSISFSGGPNPGGLLGQTWVAVDHSTGGSRGNVYVLASVNRYSTSDPLDVMFARSTNGGVSWSAPVRVNDDPEGNGAYQWFGTMSVAPNGRIDVIWNDTRNDPGGYISELYYTYSLDTGQTWAQSQPVSPSFDPHVGWPSQNKIGDYYDMVSDNGGVSIAYAATFNGEQDVYFLRIGEIDCNNNGVNDQDEVAAGTSPDCNDNEIPDECDRDCNENGEPDECDIDAGFSADCNDNRLADECEVPDCNDNEIPDECDLLSGAEVDCNGNAVPDSCDIASGHSTDCNGNTIPDSCDVLQLRQAIPSVEDAAPCPGEDAFFLVDYPEATAYQWYRDGIALADGADYAGTTTAALTVLAADAEDENRYRCEVFTGCISAESSVAWLTLAPDEVVIVNHPVAEVVVCGADVPGAQFHVELESDLRASFVWSKDGVPLNASAHIVGVDTDTLSINNVGLEDLGVYTCHIENACGGVAETHPEGGRLSAIDPVYTVQPAHACAPTGGQVTFQADLAEPEGIELLWTRDGMVLSDGIDGNGTMISGSQTLALTLGNVPAALDGSVIALAAYSPSPFCLTSSFDAVLLVGDCPACSIPGDMDGDGDNDLADFALIAACFGMDATSTPDCACANATMNTIVDLDDWTRLEPLQTGPR